MAVVAALVPGVSLGLVLDRSRSSAPEASAAPGGGAGAQQSCVDAVERAAAALQLAQEVDAALSAHTDVLNDLRAQRTTQDRP